MIKLTKHHFNRPVAILAIFTILAGTILSLVARPAGRAYAAWYSDSSWQYRQKIVIDHTKVMNTDQTDFPVMIKINNQYNSIFSNAKDDGYDILFTSSDGSTKLSHEIDTFSKANKELIAWVKIPLLSYQNDTTLYMYYGNSEATDQQNKTDVWSNGYVGVWHMNESSGGANSVKNSTSVANMDGTDYGPSLGQTGKISKAVQFDGNDDRIEIASNVTNSMSGDTTYSMQAWVYQTARGTQYPGIIAKGGYGSNSGYEFLTDYGASSPCGIIVGTNQSLMTANGANVWNRWNYLSFTQTGAQQRFLVNTDTPYTSGVSPAIGNSSAYPLYIGRRSLGDSIRGTWGGLIDEVRISSVTRSDDWIRTEYNNQNDPFTFVSAQYLELNQSNYQSSLESTWVSSLWRYKQKIQITNNTASDISDLQVKISSGDLNLSSVFAKAKDNGEDIRFTAVSSNAELPYYIESYDKGTSSASFYVKIPYLPASGSSSIYLYYGNPDALMSTSSVANTFFAYDDFSGASVGSQWSVTTGNGAISQSSGTLNFSYVGAENNDWWGTKPQKIVKLNSLPSGNFEASVKLNTYTPGANTQAGIAVYTSDGAGYAWGRYKGTPDNFQLEKLASGTVTSLASTTLPMYLAIRKVGTSYSFWSSPDRINWTKTGGDYSDLAFNNVALFGKEWGSANLSFSMDDFILKTYTSTAPTLVLSGSEEELDTIAPNNPSVFTGKNILGGSVTLDSNNFYNYQTPYFSWPAVGGEGGASDSGTGVAGYYLYFGTNCGGSGADPAVTRGLLSETGSGLHYTADIGIAAPVLTEANDYCLRVKTRDIAGNTSSVVEAFVYKFENVAPSQPSYIAANPAGYTSTNSFSFSWPAASDTGGSAIAGYQYKRGGTSGDDWSQTTSATSVSTIQAYQNGENIFYVRSIDNAGNASNEAQTNYYYASNAPSKPTDLAVTPAISSDNSFSFSWTVPEHDIEITQYGYSINAAPTMQNITWTGSSTASLAVGPYATKQGVNTLYLIARDAAGNYSFDQANYATVDFDCQTAAPPTPVAVSAVDSSDRAINRWMITTQWAAGTGQDTSTFNHYLIERSTNGSTFSQLATTSSTAYIDADLSNTTTYYYRIKAVDNAGSESIASTIVSKTPTGNYPTPPTIVTDPSSESKATSATVSWVTNRISTGAVKFGKDPSNLDRSQLDAEEKTDHTIILPGLDPSTTYYYKVQSLDSARDYSENDAYSSLFTLKTLSAPGIQNVKISNITLNSADITWETSSASTALVRYGNSINYDKTWEESSSFTTQHTFKLTDLSHTTTYHFKISGLDADENSINSDDYVFDTLPMPKISAVSFDTDYSDAEPQTAISWTSNVPTTSSVEYFPKSGGNVSYEESQSELITSHKVKLTKLSDDTSYSFFVSGTDQFGNKSTSDEYIFNTPFDSRPAKISNLAVEASNVGLDKQDKAQLIVSWKTDEPATTQVEYGEGVSGDYTNKTSEDKTLTNEHFVIISDLEPSKPYHLRAISKDKGGNESVSEDTNSIPGEVPRSMLQVIYATFKNIFGWLRI